MSTLSVATVFVGRFKLMQFLKWLITCALLLVPLVPLRAADGYLDQQIADWMISSDVGLLTANATEREAFAAVLADQLAKLEKLPERALARLRLVRVFVSSGNFRAYGAQYHPSRRWLIEHGYPEEFAGNIEICNWREFITLVRSQPYALLHEMSHAYHRKLPATDGLIRAAFENAKAAGLYQQVTRGHRTELVRAYAISGHGEYFAELSEAYFGANDYFPYSRSDLKDYDPVGFAMIEVVWNIDPITGRQR